MSEGKIVPLRPVHTKSDVAAGLRMIAEDLEKGLYGFPVGTCVVVLTGHREFPTEEGATVNTNCEVFSLGPRNLPLDALGAMSFAAVRIYRSGEPE